MTRCAELLMQRRELCPVGRQLALRALNIDLRRLLDAEQRIDRLSIGDVLGDDLLDRLDLSPGLGDLNRLRHGVAGQGQIRGAELIFLEFRQRFLLLDLPGQQAEWVERKA